MMAHTTTKALEEFTPGLRRWFTVDMAELMKPFYVIALRGGTWYPGRGFLFVCFFWRSLSDSEESQSEQTQTAFFSNL